MQKIIDKQFGVPKVSQALAELLTLNMARESTRYALNYVGISNGELAVTDGRKLLVLKPMPEGIFENGLYHLTGEGFLLKVEDDKKFPKYEEIIPKDVKKIQDKNFYISADEKSASVIIKAICVAGYLLRFDWLTTTLRLMDKCGFSEIKIAAVTNDEKHERPLTIESENNGIKLLYLQMPINQL